MQSKDDNNVFDIKAEKKAASPFDVPGVPLPITTDEIVKLVREGRREGYNTDR